MSRRPLRPFEVCLGVVLGTMIADAGGGLVHAQGRLDARYAVTLGGVPFGKGAWQIDIREDQYTAVVSGATAGLIRVFTSGQGSSAVRGTVSRGQLVPSSYASSIVTDTRHDDVRMAMSNGTVKEYAAEPPTVPNPDRVPLTEAHRRGVNDPMTATLMPVPGTGDTFVPEACPRKLSIFDGRMRYDLQLAFKRLDKVRSEKGYQGTVVVCAIYFSPVAGHIPERAVIKYLIALRDMEVWLAPIAGTRLMVPYRVTIPTAIGLGVMQATEFVSVPQSARAATTGSKPQ
jgi:Protein of unknown function (DUF3108)